MAVLPVAREILVQTVGDVRKGSFGRKLTKCLVHQGQVM